MIVISALVAFLQIALALILLYLCAILLRAVRLTRPPIQKHGARIPRGVPSREPRA